MLPGASLCHRLISEVKSCTPTPQTWG